MKKFPAIVVTLLLVVVCGWTAHTYFGVALPFIDDKASAPPGGQSEVPGSGDLSGPRPVVALGWLEPAGGVIEVSGTPGDGVETLLAAEGSVVAAGEPLVHLHSRRLIELEVASIESQITEAEARLAAEKGLADARIATARLAVEKVELQSLDAKSLQKKIALLESNLELARKDYRRLEKLPEDLVSRQELERQKLLVRQSQGELDAAGADLEKLNRTREFSRRAARADFDAATAGKQQVIASIPIESLGRQLEMARLRLSETEILAPVSGTILRVFMEPGETIGRTPILQMADLERMVAVAELYETDLKRIRIGQRAVVTSAVFDSPYDKEGLPAKVTRIGKLITTPELKSLDPFARADRHVVAVRVELDEQGSRQASNLSNLQVDVVFEPPDDR